MHNEIWVGIEGHTGYEVSNTGKVRSLDRTVEASSKKSNGVKGAYTRVQHWKGKELSTKRLDSYGYPMVNLTGRKSVLTHRLVATAFIPKQFDKFTEINHKDGNKENNHVDNLEWCDRRLNVQHAFNTVLVKAVRGGSHNRALFTDEQMAIIKPVIMASSDSHASLGRVFGCHENVIASIRKGKTWKHI